MFKYIGLTAISLLSMNASAQSGLIPKQANSVFCANLSSLNQKMDVKSLKNYSFLTHDTVANFNHPSSACFYSFISDPTTNGLDLKGRVFQYSVELDTLFKKSNNYFYFDRNEYYLIPIKDFAKAQKKIAQVYQDLGKLMASREQPISKNRIMVDDIQPAYADTLPNTRMREVESKSKPSFNPHGFPIIYEKSKNSTFISIPEKGFSAMLQKNVLIISKGPSAGIYVPQYSYYDHELDSVKAMIDSARMVEYKKKEIQLDKNINNMNDEVIDTALGGNGNLPAIDPDLEFYDHMKDPKVIGFLAWRIQRDSLEWIREIHEDAKIRNQVLNRALTINVNTESLEKNNINFQNKLNEPIDVFFFMNLENIWLNQFLYNNKDLKNKLTKEQLDHLLLPKFTKNAFFTYDGIFEKGKLKFHNHYNIGDSLKNFWGATSSENLNLQLLNTIPVEKPMAIFAGLANPAEGIEWYFKLQELAIKDQNYLNDVLEKGMFYDYIKYSTVAMNVLYNMIDPKLLHGTLYGGTLLAVTGTRDYTEKYETYEIDEEGNSSWKTKDKKSQIPAFVVSSMCSNFANVHRLMEPFVKYGLATFSDSGYLINFAGKSTLNFKLILKNDMLVFTNDLALINPKPNFDKQLVSQVIVNQFYNKKMYCRIDNETVVKNLTYLGFLGNNFTKPLEKMLESTDFVEMWSTDNSYKSEGYISFRNKEKNSLIELFDLAEIMFKN